MSLRELVDADCGGANALMRMGSHFARDHALKDEGLGGNAGAAAAARMARDMQAGGSGSGAFGGPDQMVNEFLGQVRAMPPQTFRMDALLQEMRDIDAQQFHAQLARAPPVIEEVHRAVDWANEFGHQHSGGVAAGQMVPAQPQPWDIESAAAPLATNSSRDFFDAQFGDQMPAAQFDHFGGAEFSSYVSGLRDPSFGVGAAAPAGTMLAKDFFDIIDQAAMVEGPRVAEEADAQREGAVDGTQDYNSQFWNRLQDEWKKISDDEDTAHPWLTDFTDFYDPHTTYTFAADNPMLDIPDALARGQAFLEQGDLPSAILCFESAAKQQPDNGHVWELLGQSQAENEKDPNAIAALKRSLELRPDNPAAMMALAVSYTNESLQSQALGMLVQWLNSNETYRALIPSGLVEQLNGTAATTADGGDADQGAAGPPTSSMVRGPELKEVQNMFLQAVMQSQPAIDADIQEALGVLFNLSSEYDKAVDCFQAALHVRPDSAKTWNRLGASLANGNRSVEAVEAYQRALQLQPGFIRARYNVGIICINLKAYREATEHFLTALNHQATSLRRSGIAASGEGGVSGGDREPSSQMSDTIWSTMRMAVSLLGRSDLLPALETRDLATLNREFDGASGGGDGGEGGGSGSGAADQN